MLCRADKWNNHPWSIPQVTNLVNAQWYAVLHAYVSHGPTQIKLTHPDAMPVVLYLQHLVPSFLENHDDLC